MKNILTKLFGLLSLLIIPFLMASNSNSTNLYPIDTSLSIERSVQPNPALVIKNPLVNLVVWEAEAQSSNQAVFALKSDFLEENVISSACTDSGSCESTEDSCGVCAPQCVNENPLLGLAGGGGGGGGGIGGFGFFGGGFLASGIGGGGLGAVGGGNENGNGGGENPDQPIIPPDTPSVPVPEPSTWLIMGSLVMLIILLKRRRQKIEP